MQDQKSKIKPNNNSLPVIPDKLYFAIGEVSELCDLKSHVLRYWEQEFSQLNPSKRRGNRRYYRHKDVLLIRQIRHLLYEQGYTIEGARAQLAANVEQKVSEPPKSVAAVKEVNLDYIVKELEKVLELLKPHAASINIQTNVAEFVE